MSILSDVKDQLAISPDSTDFDSEILPLVNTAFFNLMQLGVGSALSVTAASEWSEYDCKPEVLETVKAYVGLKVKILFDPPQSGSAMNALTEAIKELEVRLEWNADYDT